MIVWQKHNDRVKYIIVNREIFVCLDGKFHSWTIMGGATVAWGFRTVANPDKIIKVYWIATWLDKISKEPVGSS